MKDPTASKMRLSGTLTNTARAGLARFLFQRTLVFLKPVAVQSGADLAVVTESAEVASIARAHGCVMIDEPKGTDLSGAVSQAGRYAAAQGYNRLCIIPADLAAPWQGDLIRFLHSRAAVTICPSVDLGTNALLVSPPDAIIFRYGISSAQRHGEAAKSRGLTPVFMPLKSLVFDIDNAACLSRAMKEVPILAEVYV
ncbi:MAG: 2-phospho-L-lactate guanylyltransferase [Aestuariivita sp.]|nr:2-phospho-L-lactate guanylyltransferase [Aestuariivita sp.]